MFHFGTYCRRMGKLTPAKYYNLDAIIAVGYRVNSYQATQFRIWATKTLREFIIKGFVHGRRAAETGQAGLRQGLL